MQDSDSSDDDGNDGSQGFKRKKSVENQVPAVEDFHSEKKEELRFNKGDIITIIEKPSPEWWRGELNGKTGLVPRSHLLDTSPVEPEPVAELGKKPQLPKRESMMSLNIVLSGIDAVSPQGVQSAKNRKASQKDIDLSQRLSRKARGKMVAAPVPQIQAQDILQPSYQGWLAKQGGSLRGWKRYWLVLKDYCLYYFKDAVGTNALGCITLPSYTVTATKEVGKKFAFKVFHSGTRSYFFHAESESEMTLWIRALTRAAMGDITPSSSPSPSTPGAQTPTKRPLSNGPLDDDRLRSSSVSSIDSTSGLGGRSPRKPVPRPPTIIEGATNTGSQVHTRQQTG